jgi:DNA-binding NarL/FixJ family response regulator
VSFNHQRETNRSSQLFIMTINLIDNHILLTQAMKRLLLNQPHINEVREYENVETFLNDINPVPDIIITDIEMAGISGVKLLELYRKKHIGKTKTIVLSAINDVAIIRQCIYSGTDAYLSKASSMDELLYAIEEVAAGNKYIEKALRYSLLNPANDAPA